MLGTLDKPVDSQIGITSIVSPCSRHRQWLWPPVKEVEIRYVDPYFYDLL